MNPVLVVGAGVGQALAPTHFVVTLFTFTPVCMCI